MVCMEAQAVHVFLTAQMDGGSNDKVHINRIRLYDTSLIRFKSDILSLHHFSELYNHVPWLYFHAQFS